MTLATNNRMTHDPRHANAGVLGTYVSDLPRYNANIFRRTSMSSPAAGPSLVGPVVDPSYGGAGQASVFEVSRPEDWRTPWMSSGNMLQADGFGNATYISDPALHTLSIDKGTVQSIDKGTVPEHMLRKPAAAPAKPVVATPALITGNARGSMKPPAALSIPNQRIPMGEALMRIGGAGVAASGQGGLAAIGAATNAYGQIQDANRQAEMEAFAIEEARRKSIADRMAASQAPAAADADAKAASASAAVKYQTAQEVLAGFREHDGVVGWMSLGLRQWDKLTGNQRENIRLKISSLLVDRTLSYVAQTKGAISEKEMAIFASDQPSWTAGEEIWVKWVQDYAEALRVMHTNLQGGSTIGQYSDGATSNFSDTGSTAAPLVFYPATGTWSDEG